MSSKITGKEVWSVVKNLPQLRGKDAHLRVFQPYVEGIDNILADHLDKRVNVLSIAEARLAFKKYLELHGFATQAINALPDPEFFHKQDLIRWLKTDGQAEIDKLMNMIIDLDVFLRLNHVSQQTVMEVLFGQAEVEMTIGELLLKRPELIVLETFSSLFKNA